MPIEIDEIDISVSGRALEQLHNDLSWDPGTDWDGCDNLQDALRPRA